MLPVCRYSKIGCCTLEVWTQIVADVGSVTAVGCAAAQQSEICHQVAGLFCGAKVLPDRKTSMPKKQTRPVFGFRWWCVWKGRHHVTFLPESNSSHKEGSPWISNTSLPSALHWSIFSRAAKIYKFGSRNSRIR